MSFCPPEHGNGFVLYPLSSDYNSGNNLKRIVMLGEMDKNVIVSLFLTQF